MWKNRDDAASFWHLIEYHNDKGQPNRTRCHWQPDYQTKASPVLTFYDC